VQTSAKLVISSKKILLIDVTLTHDFPLLVEHYTFMERSKAQPNSTKLEKLTGHAIRLLQSDSNLLIPSLTAKFKWQLDFHFPFPAYIHLVQDLRRSPQQAQAAQAWEAMDANYSARSILEEPHSNAFIKLMTRPILQAWSQREATSSEMLVVPNIVADLQRRTAELGQGFKEDQELAAPDASLFTNTTLSDQYPSLFELGTWDDLQYQSWMNAAMIEPTANPMDWSSSLGDGLLRILSTLQENSGSSIHRTI
jgi:hypothetical protein